MKSRAEILAKAKSLEYFRTDSVQTKARYILLDIAGDSEADMLSGSGISSYLRSLEPGGVSFSAGLLVVMFLDS